MTRPFLHRHLLPALLLGSVLLSSAGAILKIMHAASADTWLIASVVVLVLFVVLAIWEVHTSPRHPAFHKTLWTVALLFFGHLAGLLYLLLGRQPLAKHG
jgi:uncharacterized membrane protein SirB2